MSLPIFSHVGSSTKQKGNEVGRLLYRWPSFGGLSTIRALVIVSVNLHAKFEVPTASLFPKI